MRASYLRRREPFDDILLRTLSRGWSEQYGAPIAAVAGRQPDGAPWLLNRVLNGYFSADAGEPVRRYLRDNFRYTQVRERVWAQWAVGSAISHPALVRALARPAFTVVGDMPASDGLLVIPGNQRIRVFDFRTGSTRVFLKAGFSPSAIRNEVAVRGGGDGPFPRLSSWGATWFEEPILNAVALSRVASPRERKGFERRALLDLQAWFDKRTRLVDVGQHVQRLVSRITGNVADKPTHLSRSQSRGILDLLPLLARAAAPLVQILLCQSHGDLMIDNILASRIDERAFVTDWERSAERFYWYDFLVYFLRSRFPHGLAARIGSFLQEGVPHAPVDFPASPAWRRSATALFLLEDLNCNLSNNSSPLFYSVPDDFKMLLDELRRFDLALLAPVAGGAPPLRPPPPLTMALRNRPLRAPPLRSGPPPLPDASDRPNGSRRRLRPPADYAPAQRTSARDPG